LERWAQTLLVATLTVCIGNAKARLSALACGDSGKRVNSLLGLTA
jgi:hypothetical protein